MELEAVRPEGQASTSWVVYRPRLSKTWRYDRSLTKLAMRGVCLPGNGALLTPGVIHYDSAVRAQPGDICYIFRMMGTKQVHYTCSFFAISLTATSSTCQIEEINSGSL